jgi:cytochrome b561
MKTMHWKNSIDAYGKLSMLLHWVTAAAFIAAYVIAYYVIWFVDPETSVKPPLFGVAPQPDRVIPLLNIHWILGITIGVLVLPRLLWRLFGSTPQPLGESRAETLAADVAHWALYALLFVMPLSGYTTTNHGADFGLFALPPFKDTALFAWIASNFGLTWPEVEERMWAIHSFTGQWLAWPLVLTHIGAALYHHFVRKDRVLVRMLPRGSMPSPPGALP